VYVVFWFWGIDVAVEWRDEVKEEEELLLVDDGFVC
jgi:hypothetical protein